MPPRRSTANSTKLTSLPPELLKELADRLKNNAAAVAYFRASGTVGRDATAHLPTYPRAEAPPPMNRVPPSSFPFVRQPSDARVRRMVDVLRSASAFLSSGAMVQAPAPAEIVRATKDFATRSRVGDTREKVSFVLSPGVSESWLRNGRLNNTFTINGAPYSWLVSIDVEVSFRNKDATMTLKFLLSHVPGSYNERRGAMFALKLVSWSMYDRFGRDKYKYGAVVDGVQFDTLFATPEKIRIKDTNKSQPHPLKWTRIVTYSVQLVLTIHRALKVLGIPWNFRKMRFEHQLRGLQEDVAAQLDAYVTDVLKLQ